MHAKDEQIVVSVFGCSPHVIAENVIMTFDDRLRHFAQLLDTPEYFGSWWKGVSGTYEGVPVSILVCGIGASQAGDCVMFLGHTQCRRLLFAGCAGALNPALHPGELIVVKKAIIGEGFSPYFSRTETVLASSELVSKTKAYFESRAIALHEVTIFTTGSLYAETKPFLISIREREIDCIDMETSAVYVAAVHKNILAEAVHCVSELLPVEDAAVHHKDSPREPYSKMPNLALNLMKYLSQEEDKTWLEDSSGGSRSQE